MVTGVQTCAFRSLDGRLTLDTAFTRLTGRSAVMLAGMTPTTVDPEIVAAAANAGYWSELAGGGQTTAKVLADNLEGLQRRLEPGRTAAFNAMFMNRYKHGFSDDLFYIL